MTVTTWSLPSAGFVNPGYLSAPAGIVDANASAGFEIIGWSTVNVAFEGTYAGQTVVHEQTDDTTGATGWYPVQGFAGDGTAAGGGVSTSGNSYSFPVLGVRHRIRFTALASGTAVARITLDDVDHIFMGSVVVAGSGTLAAQVQGNVASGVADSGNPVKVGLKYNSSPPNLTDGWRSDLQGDSKGNLRITVMDAGGSSAASVQNNLGDGMTNATNVLFTQARGALNNGTTWDKTLSIQGASVTGLGVQAVANTPTSQGAQAPLNAATTVAASNIVLKGSPGNLYSVNITAGASAGYIMAFNATSAPVDGTVTPLWVMPVAANAGLAFSWENFPLRCSTGITLVFSTTGPFSKTASATAFMQGTYA